MVDILERQEQREDDDEQQEEAQAEGEVHPDPEPQDIPEENAQDGDRPEEAAPEQNGKFYCNGRQTDEQQSPFESEYH